MMNDQLCNGCEFLFYIFLYLFGHDQTNVFGFYEMFELLRRQKRDYCDCHECEIFFFSQICIA